jgi:hypothetical protein
VTYLEARRVETLFKTYRQLALDYWAAVEPINYGPNAWMAGPGAATHKDTEKSASEQRHFTGAGSDGASSSHGVG